MASYQETKHGGSQDKWLNNWQEKRENSCCLRRIQIESESKIDGVKNKNRRIDGSGSEIEVKFYKTFEETNNLGFFVSYRYLKYKVKGIDEFVDSRGNNGTSRFPASQWIQNSLQIGLNLPIKFKG